MTTQAMNAFGRALRADPAMVDGLNAALAGKQGIEGAESFAAFARARGFDVGREDAEALRQVAGAQDGTLSDAQLDSVAGGGWNLDWLRPLLNGGGEVFNGVGNAMKHLAGN